MKTLLAFILFGVTLLPALSGEEDLFKVRPFGQAGPILEPEGLTPPRKLMVQRKYMVQNISPTDLYVFGHALDQLWLQILTKNPKTSEWEELPRMFCGNDTRFYPLKRGHFFPATVALPMALSTREFKIRFTCYTSPANETGRSVTTTPLLMNPNPASP